MGVTKDELVANYPRLRHMAHDGAWPALRDHGLKSAAALLDDYAIDGERRVQLGSRRRPESVALTAKGMPGAVLRDQKPMTDDKLAACLLDGLAPQDWYELLNSRTFFWLSRSRIWTLLGARAYRNVKQTVLTLDTASLVATHGDRIWLSSINSGATLFQAQPRGLGTFQRIPDYPFTERRMGRTLDAAVVELVVDHSVPDVADHVLAVHSVRNQDILEEIWRSPKASDDDHP
jgi:hypothetical protein